MSVAVACALAKANCGSPWSQTFNYDIFGNLSKSGTQSFQPTYSYLTNHMTQIGSSTPTYDANGNVTNDFLHTYAWDAAGRPVTIDGVGVTYDASGRMVEQNRSGVYEQIAYSPTGAKLALMSGQSLSKAFVPLTGGSMAVYNSSGLAYYRHADWLGSSRLAATPARAMYYDGAYAPFGEPYAQNGTADLSFTGMNQDTVANLYDFPAREYGTQGRWPSPDPAGITSVNVKDPQTWNRYAYVRNNPLAATDPTGMKCDPAVGCDVSDGDGGDGGDGGDFGGGGGDGGGVGGGGGGGDNSCGFLGSCDGGSGGTPDPGPGNGGDNGSSCGFVGCSDGPSDPNSGTQDPGCGALSCGDPGTNSGTTNGDPSDSGANQCQAPTCSSQTTCDSSACSNVTTVTVTATAPDADEVYLQQLSGQIIRDTGGQNGVLELYGISVVAGFVVELGPAVYNNFLLNPENYFNCAAGALSPFPGGPGFWGNVCSLGSQIGQTVHNKLSNP